MQLMRERLQIEQLLVRHLLVPVKQGCDQVTNETLDAVHPGPAADPGCAAVCARLPDGVRQAAGQAVKTVRYPAKLAVFTVCVPALTPVKSASKHSDGPHNCPHTARHVQRLVRTYVCCWPNVWAQTCKLVPMLLLLYSGFRHTHCTCCICISSSRLRQRRRSSISAVQAP